MSKNLRFDRCLFLDLEQTCWRDGSPPLGQRSEIIEIGLVELDVRTGEFLREESFLCRPVDSEISEFCTELTGISPRDMKVQGRHFGDTVRAIAKTWGPRNKMAFSWGDDESDLRNECTLKGAENPFGSIQDLGALFGLLTNANAAVKIDSRTKLGLDRGLDLLGMKFEGRRHSAVPDARNAARIWREASRRLWANEPALTNESSLKI